MAETAPERLTRMLAMVAYLRDHPAVTVDEVAEHFGITPRQVLADVNTLWVSGTPGYMHGDLIDFSSDDLEHGVLTLLDSREMDRPLRLSPGEAVALLVALQSLAATLGPDDAELVEETIAVLRTAAGEAAVAADAIRLHSGGRALDERVQQVREALTSGRRLHLRYVSASDQITEREVDPLQLLTDSQRWYLLAWCRRAQDVRQFRIDRILTLRVLDVSADPHPDVELTGRPEPDTARATQVRFEISPRTRWLAEQLPGARTEDLEDGWIAITVGVVDMAWLANLLMGLGDDVRAVEPPDVAAQLRDRARSALAAYAALDLL